jgi:small subunit ribosomal protein S21
MLEFWPGSIRFPTQKSAGAQYRWTAGVDSAIGVTLGLALRSARWRLSSDRPATRAAPQTSKDLCVQVLVRDNNVDQALKALKKKMQREGIFREMKLRGHYEKPSEKRAREKAEALRRARKLARKKLQREGLLPMKPKPAFPAR